MPSNVVDMYNAATQKWSTLTPLNLPRHYIYALPVENVVVLAGGMLAGQLALVFSL